MTVPRMSKHRVAVLKVVEVVSLEGVTVVIVEGSYVSLLRHVDRRIFIAQSRGDPGGDRSERPSAP